MFSLASCNYGRVLFEENIPEKAVSSSLEILNLCPPLVNALSSPAVSQEEKHKVVEKVFPKEMHNFINYLCDNGQIGLFNDIYNVYDNLKLEDHGGIRAEYICVTPPGKDRTEKIKDIIKQKYGKEKVVLSIIKKPELIGGFILRVGDTEYDRSIKTSLVDLSRKLERR